MEILVYVDYSDVIQLHTQSLSLFLSLFLSLPLSWIVNGCLVNDIRSDSQGIISSLEVYHVAGVKCNCKCLVVRVLYYFALEVKLYYLI